MNTILLEMLATADPQTVKPPTTWMPENAGTFRGTDGLFYFIYWICAFFLVLIAGLLVFFAIRYRQKNKQGTAHGSAHNTALEITWSVIPAGFLAVMFIWGFKDALKMAEPPQIAPEHEIMVTGQKWSWTFMYPDGMTSMPVSYEEDGEAATDRYAGLHVPAGHPIRLTLRSTDVIHSVFIPAFRVKKDVVPGRYTQLWFEAVYDEGKGELVEVTMPNPDDGGQTEVTLLANRYDLFCTEYCGTDHSEMVTSVYVYTEEDYATWYDAKALIDPTKPLWEVGRDLYSSQGCATCHSLDGSSGTGPTWQGLYGSQRATNNGTFEANAQFIIDSILNPDANIAAGFKSGMSSFGHLNGRQLMALVEFMKAPEAEVAPAEGAVWGDLNLDGTPVTDDEEDGEPSDEEEAPESGNGEE